MAAVADVDLLPPWRPQDAAEIREMRQRLEESASPQNLKRGPGGTMDTEFIVQMLQLKHGRDLPQIRVPGTLAALDALEKAGCLDADDAEFLAQVLPLPTQRRSPHPPDGLRRPARVPDEPRELAKLAYLLGYSDPDELRARSRRRLARNPRTLRPHLRRSRARAIPQPAGHWTGGGNSPAILAGMYSLIRPAPGITHRHPPSTASYDCADSTKILPSPIRPVRAASTILRITSSARASSTHAVISTFGRNAWAYSLSRIVVLVEIALLPAHALHLADVHRLERRAAQAFENPLGEKGLHDGDDLFHGRAVSYQLLAVSQKTGQPHCRSPSG